MLWGDNLTTRYTDKIDASVALDIKAASIQQTDNQSLLSFYRSLTRLRNTYPALADGKMTKHAVYNESQDTKYKQIAAWYMSKENETLLVIHNFGDADIQLPITDKIDKVLTHKWFGLPIFALIMFLVYQMTFFIGKDILGELVAKGIKLLGGGIDSLLIKLNAPELLRGFVTDGLIGGVGAVVEFIPLIMIMYLFIGILEDSGYMARAAYVMDSIMRALGLHGKTFISMLIGTGCNVPGVMSTRTLDNKKDRMIAILINPFISCGARLPVYLLFISAFFPNHGGIILFSLYILGFLVAILMGKLFSNTIFKGETSDFIMELPPYRVPSLEGVLLNMWDKVSSFLKRAGTTILAIVTGLWVLSILPLGVEPYSQASFLGRIGSFIAPIFSLAGFGTWQASVSLISGVAAKEAIVATLGMVYTGAEGGQNLIKAIQQSFTPLSSLSFMIMTLLYTPCAGVLATIKKETNSRKWSLFTAVYTFIIGWIMAVLIYQVGRLFGL